MGRWRKCMRVRSIKLISRAAATLSVVPALMLSPLAGQAILVHDHHGHDTHTHALRAYELDELQRHSERHHEEHDHDDRASDSTDGEDLSLLILLDLPGRFTYGRALSGPGTAIAGPHPAPLTNGVATVTQPSDGPCHTYAWILTPPVRADGSLGGILLTSHALLL